MADDTDELDWADALITRLVELLQVDPELHEAVIRAIGANADYALARAEHERALAERARRT